MYYIWYSAETGEILGYSEGEVYEHFDVYITSDVSPDDYGWENCSVVNGQLVVTLEGYKYKAKRELDNACNSNLGFEVASGKYISYLEGEKLLIYRVYYQLQRNSYVLPVVSNLDSGEESAIVYQTQADIQSAIDSIIAHLTEFRIFKAQKKDAINAATSKEQIEAIDLVPPTFNI